MQKQSLALLILDLLHDNKVAKEALLSSNFEEDFNVNMDSTSIQNRVEATNYLISKNYIQVEDNHLLAFTPKGGKYWESIFKVNWNLYHEVIYVLDNDFNENFYLYACNKELIKLAIDRSNFFLNDCVIEIAKEWNPIYWKLEFKGFYIQTNISNEYFSRLPTILPSYRDLSILH